MRLHELSCDVCHVHLGWTDGYISGVYCDDHQKEGEEE